MSKSAEWDLIVVGAGAAGIGAGLAARAAGLKTQILEAADRIGGRAHTVRERGIAYDLGCHFLHSASRNPFSLAALTRGETIRMHGTQGAFPPALYRDGVLQDEETRAACGRYYAECYQRSLAVQADVSVAAAIDGQSPFRDIYTGWCGAIVGVPPERISTEDVKAYAETGEDWPVKDGYGALIAGLADGLPIRTGCPVTGIDRTGETVRVETPDGTLTARAVIVTVSPDVLRSGSIRFTPDLPNSVRAALEDVRLGFAERVALFTDGPVMDPPVIAHIMPRAGHMIGVNFHEFGQNTIGGYLAGDLAADLAREGGRAALIDYTLDAVVEILGSDLRGKILGAISSCWSTDPNILGGYSAALPGRHAARAALREPFDDRLALAGEACSPDAFSTAHGAYITGTHAVSRMLQGGLRASRD